MLEGATQPTLAANLLQTKLNQRQNRAFHLKLSYATAKLDLIHLLPTVSHKTPPTTTMLIGTTVVPHSQTIRLLGLTIDQKLSFREHAAGAIARTQSAIPLIQRMGFSRGASILTLHHMAKTILIPTVLWGSEIWWTGARHIIDNFNPTYLPTWTRTDKLLAASSLPHLEP